jgi:low affinity Fe/Cu permease
MVDHGVAERDEHADKAPVSTAVHRVGDLAAHELAVPVVFAGVVGWVVAWLALDRPGWLLDTFEIVAAAITVVMVFVLQHAQKRLEQATQLKLDELIAALPEADDTVIKAEAAPDDELRERVAHNLGRRDDLRNG